MANLTGKPRQAKFSIGRVLWLCSAILIPIAGVHGIWYWLEYRAVQSWIDALHAAGEPIEPADFEKNIEAQDNAAEDVAAAATIIEENTIHLRSIDWLPSTRPTPREAWPYLEAAATWYEPAMRRIDLATNKSHCEWGHRLQSPVFDHLTLPELKLCDSVAELLFASAVVEHHRRHDALALRRLGQILYVSKACEHSPSEIGHLNANSNVWGFAHRLEELLPGLKIDDTNPDAIRPTDIRALITLLCDESSTEASLRFAFASERMETLDFYRSFSAHPEVGPLEIYGDYLCKPWTLETARRQLDEQTAMKAAVTSATNWPAVQAQIAQIPDPSGHFAYISKREELTKLAQSHFSRLTDRRLAAAALAIRLYRHEHQEAFPPTLEALVPKYLPTVPLDPMASGAPPLHYIAVGSDPILYSVGDDGIDNGGSEAAEPGKYGELNEWERLDWVFHLTDRDRPYLCISRPPSPYGYMGGPYPQTAPWEQDGTTQPSR